MKKTFLISIALILFFIGLVNEVSACKCLNHDAKTRFGSAEKIFLGKVLSVGPYGDGLLAEFEVLDSWKGVETKRIMVTTPTSDSGSCGENFEVGEKKLLWINGTSAQTCDSAVENPDEFLRGKPKLKLNPANASSESAGDQDQPHTTDEVITDPPADENESWLRSNNLIIFIAAFFLIDLVSIGLFLLLRSRRRN
ncbi:MAG: hypothetical protein KDB79_04725 [Acidobacteria bacterium]|nr:hypothetical protein [Acidobacteriota bacterium]